MKLFLRNKHSQAFFMQENVCFLKCLSTVIETCKNKMKIWIVANSEENFSMFVATCTYHRLKLTFWICTQGVIPLETTAAVDPFLPVVFPKTDHCRTCIWHPCHHLTGVGHYQNLKVQHSFHPPCHRASSWSNFHMSISQGICHTWCCILLVEYLMTVLYLPKTVSFPQHLFVSSAEQPPPPPFAVSLFLVGRNVLTLKSWRFSFLRLQTAKGCYQSLGWES